MANRAYYSEFDPNAAAWLRELIRGGHIADGEVDERDLWDVHPDDLRGFTQVHLCAGIGVWSYALRCAGWPDDRPVWTASFPCQPFSAAGKGAGFADERHLWPAGYHLLAELRPAVIFGEQVASKDAEPWLDLVQADMEAVGYAVGAVPFPSAGIGAPHIRDRLYWVADAGSQGLAQQRGGWQQRPRSAEDGPSGQLADAGRAGLAQRVGVAGVSSRSSGADEGEALVGGGLRPTGGLGHSERLGAGRDTGAGLGEDGGHRGWHVGDDARSSGATAGGMEHAHGEGRGEGQRHDTTAGHRPPAPAAGQLGHPGPTNGLWRDADWLLCRDGKWRPVRSSAQQMVDGSTASLGRLRDSSVREIEAAVETWALRHQRDGAEAVRNLWDLLSSEEAGQRQDGGFDSVREAPFLLALLRQLSNQGWKFPLGDERASSQASGTALRVLRFDEQAAYSSRGRGLDEQRPDEPSDPLRELSQIVAHFAEECWGLSGWQNVGSFPLVTGAKARVSRLRGYGNAINAEAAIAWIETYLEATDPRRNARLIEDMLS